ncbi:DnaJ-like protein subfamily B member 4 [Auxenochlorella protothecoides]|uniref:DnaJ-like protein subfamily B member 4 n=2 Tax=Auxenochlorella protothecoides TaxID=3075 RepID=A0A087SQG8_AUXPR|nr:DnaJ-like protein subfamily B member 4 [Auxenochlorella protothecoides]KFM27972.1 DnaJ-like protein subfamily B member 4 [Auxenochlorella protothecoides]
MHQLAQETVERALQIDTSQVGGAQADLSSALRPASLLELRYVRLLSSLSALSYGLSAWKPGWLARRHGLTLVATSTACAAALATPGGQALAAAGDSDAMAPEPALVRQRCAALAPREAEHEGEDATPGGAAGSTDTATRPGIDRWYVADCARTGVRYVVLQGSDTLDHWRVNLTFDPVPFEGAELGTQVHRGVYELACALYPVFLPLVREHVMAAATDSPGAPPRRLAFTGHSLGGSVGVVLSLMLVARGELAPRHLAPVYTFGAPAVLHDGTNDGLLCALGLDEGAVRGVTMHRDIVPRAFACDYAPLAEVLRRLSAAFRGHGGLAPGAGRQAMYRHVGRLYVLQPPAELRFTAREGYHPLLPAAPGLFRFVAPGGGTRGATARAGPAPSSTAPSTKPCTRPDSLANAVWAFMNDTHPLDTLADPAAYGHAGSISRFHNPDNYTRACGAVLRCAGARLERITDPVAFQKMLADMKAKAEEQRLLAAKREAERAKREGANYKPGASESIPARAADEVEAVGRKVDAQRDYYATLGIESCAAVAEIKAAYKKLALLYHPDKHKAEDAEQQAAIADKFREAAEAFEVLSDERSRALYDKVRDYQGANPGRGLPLLSREEAAMMASGAAELARLRRLGTKHIKHAPSARSVALPLEQLNSGCMKTVTFSRRRVDDHGIEYSSTRSFYLVIRKGSHQGDVLTFESEGDETVDTQPGDLLVTLAAEPHPRFRRSGPKDLETFCGLLPAAQFFAAVEVPTPSGAPRTLCARILPQLLASGGAGGTWVGTVRGQGLFDHDDPWGAPPGDLRACLRYPALRLRPGSVRVAARPGLLLLFGSASDPISGAALGGLLAAQLAHEALTQDLREGEGEGACSVELLDEEMAALESADALVLVSAESGEGSEGGAGAMGVTTPMGRVPAPDLSASPSGARASTPFTPPPPLLLRTLLAPLLARGAAVAGMGGALPLLHSAGVLPWYCACAGEADGGWRGLHREAQRSAVPCVGVAAGAGYRVDALTGEAHAIVAPGTDALVAAASWEAGPGEPQGFEADEDRGFLLALEPGAA